LNYPLSLLLALIEMGASPAIYAPLFARGLRISPCFSPSLLLAFAGGYCYNLSGSALFLQMYPVEVSAYFPNSHFDFSA